MKKGFTLIEILIVVAIIGLLAGIAIPAFRRAQLDTQRRIIQNNLMQVNKAAIQYFMENNVPYSTPVTYDQLVTLGYLGPIHSLIGENYSLVGAERDLGSNMDDFIVFAFGGFLPAGHPLQIQRGNNPIETIF